MSFDSQPTLTGRLVTARPLRESDYDALFAVASDPLLWEQHPDSDRYQPAVFRALFEESMASGGALLVHDAESGSVIGSSRYHGYDAELSEVEIGWTFLARSHWGGRYNGELKQLMLEHAFRFVRSVVFIVGADNIRSQQAVLKIGAVRDPARDAPGRLCFRIRTAGTLRPRLVPALLVKNMDETLGFYRKLGFELAGCHPDEEHPSWAEVTRDGIALQFHTEPPSGTPPEPVCSGTFYFYPEDVRVLAEEMRDKVEFAWGPEVMDYGMREFGVRDPNGYYLAFTEPAEQVDK